MARVLALVQSFAMTAGWLAMLFFVEEQQLIAMKVQVLPLSSHPKERLPECNDKDHHGNHRGVCYPVDWSI